MPAPRPERSSFLLASFGREEKKAGVEGGIGAQIKLTILLLIGNY
jgi:hypothetical protein